MALKSTIYKATLQIADIDRGLYTDHALTLARPPSETEERLMIGGTANLTRFGHDFPLTIRPVLEALEEQVVLLKLLGEVNESGMTVRIGHENAYEGLNSTSVVSVGYGSGGETVAKLGVVGPTRMDYPGTMGAVRAVARYVGQILAES